MRRLLELLLSATLAAAALPALASPERYSSAIWAQIAVGSDGRTAQVSFPHATHYPAPLIEALGHRLSRAEFEPVQRDGEPQPFTAPARVELEVERADEGGRVRIAEVRFGPRPLRLYAPHYPHRARQQFREGDLTLRCELGADGRCAQITVAERGTGVPNELVRAARDALRRAEFELPTIGGLPQTSTLLWPVRFRMRGEHEVPDGTDERVRYEQAQWLRTRARIADGQVFPVR
jgi:TonB family protein